MTKLGARQRMMGTAPTPKQVIASLRWLGELEPDEIVAAIKRGADRTHPDLPPEEIAEMRDLAGSMTKSRLRAWKDPSNFTQPTWLEVRALMAGLYETLE